MGLCALLARLWSRRNDHKPSVNAALLRWLGRLFLLLPISVVAQQIPFHKYEQQDGLSNLSVTSLYQDRGGYIWVGTENGLYRHDSTGFQRFGEPEGLEDTSVHSTFEDGAGRLWVGTSHDLYVRDDGTFRAVRPDGRELNVLSGMRIASITPNRLLVVDREELTELWRLPGGGTWHRRAFFNAGQLQEAPQLAHVISVYADAQGRIWLGCGDSICRIEHRRVDTWGTRSGLPRDSWRNWLVDREGRVWVRGPQHVAVLVPGATRFELRDGPHTRLSSALTATPLIEDRQGRIITRSDMGLERWQDERWQEFTAANGVTTPQIYAMLASHDGTVWLGMSGHGLWRWLGYENFESWTLAQGLDTNPVWDIVRGPDGAITVATRSGCLQIDGQTRASRPCLYQGLPGGEIQVMAKRGDGSLWIGMSTGELLRVPAGRRRAEFVGTIHLFRKLLVDSADRLWICSNDALRVIGPGSTRVESTRPPDGLGEFTDAAEDEDRSIWFATQGGLLHWVDGNWTLVKFSTPLRDGFSSVTPAGQGWLWAAGATHGLMRLHVDAGHADHAQWISDGGMASAAVYFTRLDRRRWLWVGTDEGFYLFDGRAWRKFTQADGLIWNDTDQNAVMSDIDGSLWIGTSGGLTHVLRPENLISANPLDLRIERASVGSTPLDGGRQSSIAWPGNPALDVHLTALDFGESSQLVLNVRLRGLSDEWFQTKDFNLHFPGLAPGHYAYEAYALDRPHQRYSQLVRLSFEIEPPWWQSNWFRILVVLGILAALMLAWQWSVRKLDDRRKILERELREREALLERATRDPLTRLWNRQAILEILSREIETARHTSRPLAIALIDLDHFKRINDTMGHLAGDEVLRLLGEQLSGRLRDGDSLGRYGGEELLLIVPDASPQRPFLPMERLQRLIPEIPFAHNGNRFRVTASFGVAWLASSSDTAEKLISRADDALYAAKFSGRDRVEYAATGS